MGHSGQVDNPGIPPVMVLVVFLLVFGGCYLSKALVEVLK